MTSRYTQEELRGMAVAVLQAKEALDVRYVVLVSTISAITGIPEHEVVENIKKLAAGEEVP